MARARTGNGSRTHPSTRRVAASVVAVATALLIGAPAGHAASPQRARIMSRLGKLRYSSGVLQAMAVHAGLHPRVGSGPGSPAGGTASTVLANVQANPASDLLVLDTGALIPVVFVLSRDDGAILVDLPEGLLDL